MGNGKALGTFPTRKKAEEIQLAFCLVYAVAYLSTETPKENVMDRGLQRQPSGAVPPRRRASSNYQTVLDVAAERHVGISSPPNDQHVAAVLSSSGVDRPPRPGAGSFKLLQAKFGFQEGNVRNQKEHFECWVLNHESRLLKSAVTPIDTENAIETIHFKFFRNYVKWCKFLRTKPYLLETASYPGAAERQVALFLLIWGESANLRFMPECLCFLYHKMAAKLNEIERLPNAPEDTFLRRIVRPLYLVVAEMREVKAKKNGASVDHKNVTNYDDVNEFFWQDDCLHFDEFNVAQALNVRDYKTFKERRSVCNPFLAFFRIYFFLFVMLHILIVIAYVAHRSDPDDTDGLKFYANFFSSDITDVRKHAFYSIFVTISGLLALKVVLDIWIYGTRIFSRVVHTVSVFVRLVWHTVFFGIFAAVNAAPYENVVGSSDLLTMAPLFIGVYMLPIVIVSIVQMFYRGIIWNSALLSSMDGTREHYIGRSMNQSWRDFLNYGLFWTVIFVCKFLFNLQLMVKPLIGPSVEIYNVDLSTTQLENGILETKHNIAFLIAMWAPVVLVYIYDSQIWLAIAQSIVGAWIGFRLKIGHSARINEFVKRLQQAPSLFDEKIVSAAARGQLAINNNPLSANCAAPDANSRLRFAVVWNEIVSSFRLSDLLDDRETAILQYQISDTGAVEEPVFLIAGEAQTAADIAARSANKRLSDIQLFKELKKAGVLNCARNCLDIMFQILQQLLGPQESEIAGVFHQILAGGRVKGVVNLSHVGLLRENFVDLLASILELPEPTVGPTGGAFIFEHEQVLLVIQRVDALLKSIELMLEEEWMAEKLRKSVFTKISPDLTYQKEQLLSIFADRISQRGSNSPSRTTSPSSNESVVSLSTRLFFLLTLDAADALPRCHEAQRRMSFFLNSLHMKIPNIDSIAAMKSFSVITPYYNETVLFSIDELNGRVDSNPLFRKVEQKGRDLSILKYLVTFHDDEWGNFLERVGVSSMDEALAATPTQVRLWASMRGQTLARTVHGMMMYEDALKMLRWLEIGSDEKISHLEKIKHMDRIAGLKFSYVTSCQIYADQLAAGDSRAADIDLLLRKYPNWRVSYVDTTYPSSVARYDCVLVKSDGDEIVEVYRYELPGHPIVGEGKPENQNIAMPFTRGEYLQTIDMNQEHYFEEALKIPNFLATATKNGQNVTIIGMKEHIFTGRASSLAHFMTLQELVFVSLTQRVMANPLQSRMHYGHPDVFEKSWVMSNGGVSKASKGINLSEDVFAGYNVALRGEKVTHEEFMQCGKGRDVTLSQINAFEAKLANGSAESSLSRESHRMGAGMDFFRLNSMFYGHMGFYICNALVVLCVFAYAYGKVYIVLREEIEESAIITTNYLDDLADVMNTQFIFQFGMLMTIPLIATLFVEYGWHQALVNFVELIVTLGPVFYIFETGTKSHFFDVAIMRGGSKYRGTGRGFAIVRETFVNFYKEYAASHYRKAVELMGLMIIFGIFGNFNIGTNALAEYCATADFDCDANPDLIPSNVTLLNSYSSKGQDYGIASFAVWLLGACWLLAPFMFNTDGLDFSKTRVDITYWLSWLMSVREEDDSERLLPNHVSSHSSNPRDTWNDFYNYESSIMFSISTTSRIVYAFRELRHPLVMYYIFIFSFDLSQIGMLLACVVAIALALWIGGFGLGRCLRNKARVVRALLYVLMVVMIGVAPFIVGSMQDWNGHKSFSLTVAIFTGLFALTHFLQLLHGIFGLHIAKWGLVRELAFFFDVVVGLFLVLPLLVLSAFPFMKTIQTRMMYNGGFSRALSSGSEFAAALSVLVGGLGGFTYGWLTCLIFSLGYVNSSSDNFVNQSFSFFNNERLDGALDLSMIKVYAAGAAAVGVAVSGGLAHAIGRRWTIEASCITTIAGCALVWLESSSVVLIGICAASSGIAMLAFVCPLYNFEICMQGWKGKGVLIFLSSAALGYMIEAVLIDDINAKAMSRNWANSPYHDWQWQFIFGILPLLLLMPSAFFLPESHYWEYRRKNDPKAAEASLMRLRQRHDVLEEAHEMKESFVIKNGHINLPFRIMLVVVLQATFALFTSGALLHRVLVQPTPNQDGEQTSKWATYYGVMTFLGSTLSLLTVDNLRRKTIFKDILPFSAALSAACGTMGLAEQEDSAITKILVCVVFVSGALSLTCGTWLTAIEVFPPYQNGRYIVMSFIVYYAVQAAIYVAEPSFAISHLAFACLCLVLTVVMFAVCASSKDGAIELKSEKKMRKEAEAARERTSFAPNASRQQSFMRSHMRRSSSHYSAATPLEASYSNFESPASIHVNGGTRRLKETKIMEVEELDLVRTDAAVANFGADMSDVAQIERISQESVEDATEDAAMDAEDDEDGWMPKPARLHTGRTRSCAVCYAPLQYTTAVSWDDYLQSEEYLQQLQANILQDTFISSLICGESTAGDLPTEHRMHKNRKLKCRQSVNDYRNMTSAGVVDEYAMEKGSIKALEEMLIESLPTPVFTHVLERRLAVISHSSKTACELMSHDKVKKTRRPVETVPGDEELHHLAIHTLGAILRGFDYTGSHALRSFEELSQILTCFPVLSLYSFWSPIKKAPDKVLVLEKDEIVATSVTSSPESHDAYGAVDGLDTTYWQSQPRPGAVYFTVKSIELVKVTSIEIHWYMKYVPQTVGIQYRTKDSEDFESAADDQLVASNGPTLIETSFSETCKEVRIVMTGMPSSNRNGIYAIKHLRLNVPASGSLFADPTSTVSAVAYWLNGALKSRDEVMAAEAISALRAWALATASLHVTMVFVKMLLDLHTEEDNPRRRRIAALAFEQGKYLLKGVMAFHRAKIYQTTRENEKAGSADVRNVSAVFESSICSTGVVIEDGGASVRTRETSYQYAAANCEISSGKASWKFRLDTDTQDDEMTCFGAAILPVSVNGYDSSPSLWMLRGYNGNLYARGHKLSRTIGKVHPGDIVQVDVDMTKGTLAYKINGTDYGVVFTDLAGHEVHPAVSFYGSGKVITLLGITKWDYTTREPLNAEPVFLSSIQEHHFSVGYGTLGKGGQLGYASNENSDSLRNVVGADSNSIRIQGEIKQRCISTHPPSKGDAYVMYDLSEAYRMFKGAVAINDDAQNEVLQTNGVSLVFKIFGDEKLLWQSKTTSETFHIEPFEVNVQDVRMLELKVSCLGSNHCAHAVWVDPYLLSVKDWVCHKCSFSNKGFSKICAVCRFGTRDNSRTLNEVKVVSEPKSPALIASEDGVEEMEAISALGVEIVSRLDELCQQQSPQSNSGVVFAKSSIQFEEPFCRQPNKDVFSLLLVVLQHYHSNCIYPGAVLSVENAQNGCVRILGIISANLESLQCHDVKGSCEELDVSSDIVTDLRHEIEAIAQIRKEHDCITETSTESISMAAARTLAANISALYQSGLDKLKLLLELLHLYTERPLDITASSSFILMSVMTRLAAPGPDGILSFMPFMAAGVAKNKDTRLKVTDQKTWLAAVTETLSLLMKVVVKGHQEQIKADIECRSHTATGNDYRLPNVALQLLKSYQLYLLSEAIELTSMNAVKDDAACAKSSMELRAKLQRRFQVQEATLHFSLLSLHACRNFIDSAIAFQADESFLLSKTAADSRASVRTYCIPLLSELLPWFVSCLCLLRRQTWLARPILPAVVSLLDALDHFCSESQIVSKSAHRFQLLESYQKSRQIEAQELERAAINEKDLASRSLPSKRLYNVFQQLYTGEKDHFDGQIGFQFEATSCFSIVALGRSVNPTRHGGNLTRDHTIRLWEEGSQLLVAEITVGGSSEKDSLGYALEILPSPLKITQGKRYRLTTQEFANGGDPWYKRENLPGEEYDESFIRVLRDCYASGSVGFPGSQNMTGAAYGVPTIFILDETPLANLSRFVPPHGCHSLRFSPTNKLNSVRISHTGTTAYAKDGTDAWRTCLLRTEFLHGVHSIDFALNSSRVGGTVSGHICIGVVWRQPLKNNYPYDTFLGEVQSSIGWMPSNGAVWVEGVRYDYGTKISIAAGDIFTITIDFDSQLVSFAYNGENLGIAVGPGDFRPIGTTIAKLPEVVTAAVSLYGAQDVVQARSSGIAKSTLRIHWLFDLHNSLASLAGRITSTLIAGVPIDGVEEELLPWLQSPLLSGGFAEGFLGQEQAHLSFPLRWSDALRAEYTRLPSTDQIVGANSMSTLSQNAPANSEQEFHFAKPAKRFEASDAVQQSNFVFWSNWTKDMSERGTVQLILSWLEKHSPDRTFLSRLGRFPVCERWMGAALIMHAPSHVLQEVEAIAAGAGASMAGRVVGADFFLAHANFSPSSDLIQVWKRILMLRHWLIKTRQEYRAKEADENSLHESARIETPEGRDFLVADGFDSAKRLSDDINLDQIVMMPRSFDDLVKQVIQRAEFLCKLAPPSEEAGRLKVDSQIALFNLAEKWGAQKTPPSLQPMLERWKALGEVDSSKWSGIVDILRAQHRWRARRASILGISKPFFSATSGSATVDDSEDTEASVHLQASKKSDYTSTFSAMMKACELYIRDGSGAPPEILSSLLERRQRRSDSRLFGLQAMKSILSKLSFDSAMHNVLIFLRPAMRGFTDSEKESRELNDGQVVAETFRATVRHHYLKGLEGCNRQTIDSVQDAFCNLYAYLAQLLGGSTSYTLSDSQLKQTIICAWSLDFEPRDHQFLLDVGILTRLQEIFSISSVLREALTRKSSNGPSRNLVKGYSSINWHPLSEQFVQQGLLRNRYVTKRDVVRLLHRVPNYACSSILWKRNGLDEDCLNVTNSLTACHTASSLSLLYAEMLCVLSKKLLGPPAHIYPSKVLTFGAIFTPAIAKGAQSSNCKPDDISYVEMPALGEVHDFTIEMWLFPAELVGCQALRCDNDLQNGSVYLELIDRHLQLSIPGNTPRERMFTSYQFRTFEWTHCAVAYNATAKYIELIVNGDFVERMEFGRVCSTIHLRASRLGCWMSGLDSQGAALTDCFAQRRFKGSIAEVRIWRIARTHFSIRQDFQRSIPLTTYQDDSSLPKSRNFTRDLIGLWHLTEGEGICGFDSASNFKALGEGPEARGFNVSISHCRWAPANIPVFGNDALNSMSSIEWGRVLRYVGLFQRKVRLWLRDEYNGSITLSKLICEQDELAAIQKSSYLNQYGDDDDSSISADDDKECPDSKKNESDTTRQAIDANTSQLISCWNACTDEQMLLSKQIRKCAWVVFRFLASTGFSGAFERREGEAKLVAAVARLKRKQRLQKDGTSESPAEGSELSHPQTRNFEDAARTAEAASDAAKSAATNRELEEPVLQTLWFTKEFHRKVFEVLDKELIQGKELTHGADGLTRAQRMLRSVSTPAQKRGANLRHYPSDVARGESGFSNNHQDASDLTSDGGVLDALEVEAHLFGVLLFVLSQSTQPPAIIYFIRPPMLQGLLEILRIASPRCQRVVKLLLRRICCSGSVKPSDVGVILGSESVLIDLLLDQVAESVCAATTPTLLHAANVATSNTLLTPDQMVSTESLSNPLGFNSGQISLVVASESVALLRRLLEEKHWHQSVAENLCSAIRNISPLLVKKKLSQPSLEATGADLSGIRFRTAIIRAVGALCVLCSHSDCIRIGGRVVVAAQGASGSGVAQGVDEREQVVSATLIEMSSHAATVRVVFHPSSSAADFDPSHNIQDVKLSSLSPIEEIDLHPTAIPLTFDMMPVILQLASLDDSNVLVHFDDLSQLQIRSRALLALRVLFRHSFDATKKFAGDILAQNLIQYALTPIKLNSFLSLPVLQERGRMILCRLIESATPLGEAMFRGLKNPTAPVLSAAETTGISDGVEAIDDPIEDETEPNRVRRGFATTLAAMGFEFDLCVAALEHTRDDPNLAVEWLMGDGAASYQERQEAKRLAQANMAAYEFADGLDGSFNSTLEAKAKELQNISGKPYCLAFCALELSNSDPNRAMEWLMEYGDEYAKKYDSVDELVDPFMTARAAVLDDIAALEEIDRPDPLVTTFESQGAISADDLRPTALTQCPKMSYVLDVDAMAVTLAPILAPKGSAKPSSLNAQAPNDASVAAFSPLDPEYLTLNILLTVTNEIGPVQQLMTSGRTGIYRCYSPNDGVLITFLNTESGAYEDEWHQPRDVRRIVKIYDEPLTGTASIHRVALKTENALSIYYARCAVTALLCSLTYDKNSSQTQFEPSILTGRAEDFEQKSTSVSSPLSNQILDIVGGPRRLVNLLKMVAASEMRYSQHMEVEAMNIFPWTDNSSRSTITKQPFSLIASLQMIILKILREEAQSDKAGQSTASRTNDLTSSNMHDFEIGERVNDKSKVSSQSMTDSIESLQPISLATNQNRGNCCHEESKSEERSRHLRIESTEPEAQQGIIADLQGDVDNQDELLSSVLVQECINHFADSTRMAGDGEVSAVQEFQSLHPYFGRCEYARAVSIDSSYRCLRIIFDHRCRLGPNAKLTFFADPECGDRIGVVDYVMTTSGHHLPDLVVHSHQFWFRFTASEESLSQDHGYGYRFQVKPMSNIRWTKEAEVQTNPSLEWACWVLELLLNDAAELVAHGAVHNRKIFNALVRYLRSPGAPFKGRVVRLLQQLLHHPEQFPPDELPELKSLESITQLALSRAELDKFNGKTFLSARLLELVELSMMIFSASSLYRSKSNAPAPFLKIPIQQPISFELKPICDSLNDVFVLTNFLLGKTAHLPQHILVAIWLEVYGSSTIIETSHPYKVNTTISGLVAFEGAQNLRLTFDSRCSLAAGQGQGIARLELATFRLDPHQGGSRKETLSTRTYAGENGWPKGPISFDGNNLEYSFHADENAGDHFGFAATVTALGICKELQISRATVQDMEQLLQKLVSLQTARNDTIEGERWTQEMDLQLVDWVNNHVDSAALLALTTPASSKHSVDLQPAEIELDQTLDGLRCSQLMRLSLESLQLRFALLKYFNLSLRHCLSFLDLRDTKSVWTVAHQLRQLSHCIFFDIKSTLVDAAIDATSVSGDTSGSSHQQTARITLDRMQALESQDDREVEPSVSECFFAQAFRQLHSVDPALFRRQIDSKGRLFSVKFRGEEGVDWGGVYREGATSMVDDLFSPHFTLFVLCPNGQHDTGNNRGMYLPNPKCTSPVAMQMFGFVGQLLGISLRTHGDFPFMFPSLVWKQLLGQTLDRADLEDTDAMFIQMLDGIANCENDGILTEEEFAVAFAGLELRFTASSCTGEEIELIPNGRLLTVGFGNRKEYCRLAERTRLHECSAQVAAMARGFATLFPRRVLTVLTWQELEILACGSPKIDLALWQRHTRYDGYTEEDETVQLFWEVLVVFQEANGHNLSNCPKKAVEMPHAAFRLLTHASFQLSFHLTHRAK
ncbi:putative HECT domain, B30.2/SPRY domain, Zinc finger, RanBP2-type, glycosyl transferase, family 48 [Plasmopara halstedii]